MKKTNNYPLITVGIPFKNNENVLEQAIRSVLNQTYQNWELLLIDDGSSDKSIEIALKYKKDKRVQVFIDNKNKGLPERLNQMISKAKGTYFCRMDSDDIMFPNRLETQFYEFCNSPNLDVVGSSAILIDQNSNIVGYRGGMNTQLNSRSILMYGAFIHPSTMGKTEWFRKYGYQKHFVLTEDIDLWLRSFQDSKFKNLETPLLFYRLPNKMNLQKLKVALRKKYELIDREITDRSILVNLKFKAYHTTKYYFSHLITCFHLDSIWLKKSTFFHPKEKYEGLENILLKATRKITFEKQSMDY